jgi:hypothetical protein
VKPYLVSDSAYLICTYLMKNFRLRNVIDIDHEDKKQFDKKQFDKNMNRTRVVIEHAFAALK